MPKLYEEDQQKVNDVLSRGVYRVDRKPFRPWLLLGAIFVMLGIITAASYLIATFHGYV